MTTIPDALLQRAAVENWTRRLHDRDASLWTNGPEAKWLGWLDAPAAGRKELAGLKALAEDVRQTGFTHLLLIGMGGSSLGPEVLAETFGRQTGFPEAIILDSTDPAQVAATEARLDLPNTIVLVASKSGSTLEPNILKQYFFARMQEAVGKDKAGRHFIAITDPGSQMQRVAEQDGFRHIFYGDPTIGGRYSVLSNFGLVPAAAMGLDLDRLLAAAEKMAAVCKAESPGDNPGLSLGLAMGGAAVSGRDKLTVIASSAIYDFGAWLEQLVAESTGKQGKGIVPVDDEPAGAPGVYGQDRFFAYLTLDGEVSATQDAAVAALEAAGHPVQRITLPDRYAIAAEFYRWEVATAIAGAVIGIDPFDQPDVEASKIETKALTAAYERDGSLPVEEPVAIEDGISVFADPENAAAIGTGGLDAMVKAHLARLGAGDYFALLAYIQRNAEHIEALRQLRLRVRDARRVATCVGFGPRFLHSTGQAYKGGPASGVFLQITCDPAQELPVPGQKYTFGVVEAAQARGDLAVLIERRRRALRVHLGRDVAGGLKRLAQAIDRALA